MSDSDHWNLVYDSFKSKQESLREALCVLGNGYFATRGAFSSSKSDDIHYPGTYLAGGYNRLGTEISGRIIENEDLVNIPNWLCLNFCIDDGEWFQIKAVEILSFEQKLNLKEGTLIRNLRFRDAHNRETSLHETRFVHMRHPHLAGIKQTIKAENWSGKIRVRSALDGCIKNEGVARYSELNQQHLDHIGTEVVKEKAIFLEVKTNQSDVRIAQAARTDYYLNEEKAQTRVSYEQKTCFIAQDCELALQKGDIVSVEKIVTLFTSKDHAISECGLEAKKNVLRAPSFNNLLTSHRNIWKTLWGQFDIAIDINSKDRERHPLIILRLHIFHLLQTVSLNTIDLDVGVPARGWHGEAYRGHIFWDELFIFPTLNLRVPKITLSLLKYRYRRLGEARENARKAGLKGAMFPWQSGSDGREESQVVHLNPKSGRWIDDHSYLQRHVNLAIGYNVWRYFETTGDFDFLRTYGAELLVEISRFFTSLCTYNSQLDKYEILGVMGPDEYHDAYPDCEKPGLDNNSYTNVLTAWLLSRTIEVLELLPDDLTQELKIILKLTDEEILKWRVIAKKMRIVFHDDGIISQFEGYEKLLEFPWDEYRKKYGDIQRLDRILEAEGDTPNRFQVSKQADVLMLFYLFSTEELETIFSQLGYPFDPDMIPRNIRYYLARTAHGSTLSRLVHSWVLSRGHRADSWELFLNALESDVADIQGGTTAEGIHLGAMAGTVDLVQRCYAGIKIKGEMLHFNPCLPDDIKRLCIHVYYRGYSLEVTLNHQKLIIRARYTTAKKIQFAFKDEIYDIMSNETKEFDLSPVSTN